MNSTTYRGLKKCLLSSIILLISLCTFAQTTYKVVCDKTDNTVKIIESENHSAKYIPIKSGFPFRQIAQKWIDENYTTTTCNPEDILKQINTQQNIPTQTQSAQPSLLTPTPPPSKLQPRRTGSNQTVTYKNTSFFMNAKFSNLGEAFMLDEKMMPEFELGLEKTFGGQVYFGTGINADFYFSDMDGQYDIDSETIYFFLDFLHLPDTVQSQTKYLQCMRQE